MKYVGIDLGTTNSAICTYDGEVVQLYKSPDQTDVTPSAIFIDKRGNKYIGTRAYNNAARSPDNAAVLFKRLMGTSTPITLSALDTTMTPEDCSAEVLRVLFGYLPDDVRNDKETGTVITVPAAFNQTQKESTMSAATSAGIGRVALMQEPVAAVMCVMRQRKSDGTFVVFDLGGGTLDVAIAQSISGRVSLLAHGGIAMCGGRDFDRLIFDRVVLPWLQEKFRLPPSIANDKSYSALTRMATWAAERAKIELSQRSSTTISLPETDIGKKDDNGDEIYLDIPFDRKMFDSLIASKVEESIEAARDTIRKAGLSSQDVERIVFVGGPTYYKSLRERVASGLGIAPSTDVNPMTAVAEGAAIFAESIDWGSQNRSRKSARGSIAAGGSLRVGFNYVARTPDIKARLAAKVDGEIASGVAFQIDSLDTGWSSGRIELKDGASVELPLAKPGDNLFKIFVFDRSGGPLVIPTDKITISRTAASIDAIPASHSIGVEARDKIGGRVVLDYLVREGEQLPKKGRKIFRAEESLKAGGSASIKFKLWEGEISEPLTDNRFVGMFEIKGSDFEDNVITAGAELVCDYEVLDSGNIVMEVSVPSIGGSFHSKRNFYSPQDAKIDYSKSAQIVADQSEETIERLDEMSRTINDPLLNQAREKLDRARSSRSAETDPEITKKAMDDVQDARRLLSLARKSHLKEIRQLELNKAVEFFTDVVKKFARPSEVATFENLVKSAQRAIEGNSTDFEALIDDMQGKNWAILWRQEWFVIDRFKNMADEPHLFPDSTLFAELLTAGAEALKANDIENLRKVVARMHFARIGAIHIEDMMAGANIVRG